MESIKATIKTETKQNFGTLIALVVIALVAIWFAGCQTTVPSLYDSTRRINKAELNAEIESFLIRAEDRYKTLARKEQLKQLLINQAFTIAKSGTINPQAIITTIGTFLGTGIAVDNIRNRKKLKAIRLTGAAEAERTFEEPASPRTDVS